MPQLTYIGNGRPNIFFKGKLYDPPTSAIRQAAKELQKALTATEDVSYDVDVICTFARAGPGGIRIQSVTISERSREYQIEALNEHGTSLRKAVEMLCTLVNAHEEELEREDSKALKAFRDIRA